MFRFALKLSLLALAAAAAAPAAARTRIRVDIDRRHDRPRITRFRRVRRFGWHSGTHYGPYVDARGVWRTGWHTGTHKDWYTVDVPVLNKIDRADWELYVKFGKDKRLSIRGDNRRTVRHTNTVVGTGGVMLGWLRHDGTVIAGGPNTPARRRFVGNGWNGVDLGNSIIMMDLPGSPGVEVYLKKRTRDLAALKPPLTQAEQKARDIAQRRAERDALLDRADQRFVRGLYPQAALLYQKAMKLEQDDSIARLAVAHSLFALGLFKTAGQNVRRGLDKFPEWGLVDLDLRTFYQRPEQFAAKLNALREYLAAHPRDDDARLLLGYCFYFSGRRTEGLKLFKGLAARPGGDKHAELFVKLARGAHYEGAGK